MATTRRQRRQGGKGRPFLPGGDHPLYRLAKEKATLTAALHNTLQALQQTKTKLDAQTTSAISIDRKQLTAFVQDKFDLHSFGNFLEPGTAVRMTGSVYCRQVFPSFSHFIQHMRDEVIPSAINEALTPR